MGETLGNKQGFRIFGGQDLAVPLTPGLGVGSKIHGHIKDLTAQATYELVFCMRCALEMQATDCTALPCQGVIDLGDWPAEADMG
jgi:hypothetical protein